jgi:hypothetical protein
VGRLLAELADRAGMEGEEREAFIENVARFNIVKHEEGARLVTKREGSPPVLDEELPRRLHEVLSNLPAAWEHALLLQQTMIALDYTREGSANKLMEAVSKAPTISPRAPFWTSHLRTRKDAARIRVTVEPDRILVHAPAGMLLNDYDTAEAVVEAMKDTKSPVMKAMIAQKPIETTFADVFGFPEVAGWKEVKRIASLSPLVNQWQRLRDAGWHFEFTKKKSFAVDHRTKMINIDRELLSQLEEHPQKAQNAVDKMAEQIGRAMEELPEPDTSRGGGSGPADQTRQPPVA